MIVNDCEKIAVEGPLENNFKKKTGGSSQAYRGLKMRWTALVAIFGMMATFGASVMQDDGVVEEMEQSECSYSPDNTDVKGIWNHERSGNGDINKGIVWRNCNRSRVDIVLYGVNTYPYPIPLGKTFQLLNFTWEVLEEFGKPDTGLVEMDLSFKMLIDGQWTELCELVGEQECYKSDFCAELANLLKGQQCPPVLQKQGFNCTCPVLKNTYHADWMLVPEINVPFEISGQFMGTVVFRKEGRDIACVELQFCIERC